MNCTIETACNVLNCPWPAYGTDFFPNVKCIGVSALRIDKVTELNVTKKDKKEVDEEIFLNMAFFAGASMNRR